ncbi:DUF4065 domain-containing protein [Bacillus albus]|uniref:Panacea domain-containing protein n=1 Tax=Bacillus albus TaxID=2026189 RepID=UPI0010099996|nr:type II toxin-antitoxin system antitoxin SocA domain-containing protein [Bacillus albus]RXJ14966.1 DUF4065 domain-containing protein [Bacillus albus]RXJ23826.1 DUF4065 domain-containing protein [Bacillus albus]RXJ23985.1 DUF4065 domain-containing protein [Bacillus albus]RXJ37311.1 DUF4065 domain-containing protein [Bacillus albus]RXJ53448.1 DUF4065 domain-containing protein [Bacillus albus]
MERAKVTAYDVAEYFLSKSKPNTEQSITHLKLQKLLYYAQGWHLAIREGKALFDNEIQAWVHGPVCPDIYKQYSKYDYFEINPTEEPQIIANNLSVKVILDAVWEAYGNYDGKFLEELTHQEEPWLKAREGFDSHDWSNKPIEHKSMTAYFKNVFNEQAS